MANAPKIFQAWSDSERYHAEAPSPKAGTRSASGTIREAGCRASSQFYTL